MRITVQRTRPRRNTEPSLAAYLRDTRSADAQSARDRRLAALERDIARLEDWHHDWRMKHDVDYRAINAEDWCDIHHGARSGCRRRCIDIGLSNLRGRVLGLLADQEPKLTDEQRRRATLRVAEIGRRAQEEGR